MVFFSQIIRLAFANRLRKIDNFRRNPIEIQNQQLDYLLSNADEINYLRSKSVHTPGDFRDKVPVVDYEQLWPSIERIIQGERNQLWNTPTPWLAKSSGTTNDKSKYIPITHQSLNKCHFQGGRDVVAIFSDNFPESKALNGKALTLGGSHNLVREGSDIISGDLSAIMIENTPKWFSLRRVPSTAAALTPDFEQKVERICRETVGQNVTSFAGVPSWNMVLMNKILEFTGKDNVHEVWPNMSFFAHGGVSFTPYREQYDRLFPDPQMRYMETYNASEGFFAIQDDPKDSSMLLMLDYGIYYEFVPLNKLGDPSAVVPLEGVQRGVNYAMIISTNGGLWRYMIGDTVEFTSTDPYKIKITGRTKQYINAFGEELIVDNAVRSLETACRATGASISYYTVAPIFMEGKEKGGHEWLIEFETEPTSVEQFVEVLDSTLQSLNSDYAAKRFHSTTLNAPVITLARPGQFYRWMMGRGKLGGQNKVPSLSPDRLILEAIVAQS